MKCGTGRRSAMAIEKCTVTTMVSSINKNWSGRFRHINCSWQVTKFSGVLHLFRDWVFKEASSKIGHKLAQKKSEKKKLGKGMLRTTGVM